MIPALIGTLIEFAPAIAGMFGGDDAEDMVSKVTDVARQVTGASDITHATQMLKASPEMQVAFQREANALHF